MPLLQYHLIADVLLIFLIYMFDKEVQKNKKLFLNVSAAVILSNLIDVDHLLATPIYDSLRCSINFHPLHSWYFMPLWIIGVFNKNKYIKYFCSGVLLHLLLDWIQCLYFM